MNDRFTELIEQAGFLTYTSGNVVESEAVGKFYELIVNECAAYLNGAMEVHNQAEQDLCDHAARKIKEHFRVE